MHRFFLALLGAFLLVVPVMPAPADEGAAVLDEEDRADLAFFRRFGLTDVTGKPFVEVRTGEGWREADGEVHVPTVRGFLLEVRDDGSFVVEIGEPFPRIYPAPDPDAPQWLRTGWRAIDLAEAVRKRLAGEGAPRASLDFDTPLAWRFAERLERCGRALALAWASACHGMDSQAHDLLAEAREGRKGALREVCKDTLAECMIWRVVEAFGTPAVSRQDLLAAFERFLDAFPDSEEHRKTAAEAVRILERMVEEDERHAHAPTPLDAMTEDERIAEWIFRLRDQNGHQFMQPGGPSIFATRSDKEDSPADRLVAIGYDAVGQLIEALDDERFTRTVGCWRDFTYSHYVVRVGGAAAAVLDHITGRSFEGGQEAWRAWWTAFSKDGITEGLAREVRGGGDGAIEAARALVRRSPAKAFDALLVGIDHVKWPFMRGYFVDILATIPGEAQLGFMQEELQGGPTLFDRLRAARWLTLHGHPEGLETITALWTRLQEDEAPDADVVVPVAIFYVSLGTEPAARILVAGLENLPVAIRARVLARFYAGSQRPERWPPLEPQAEAILLATLDDALGDESRFKPDRTAPAAPDSDTMRIAEVAARQLAFLWRDEGVTYTQDAFRADRDRQLRAIRNHARLKRGLPPLPEPERPDLPHLGNRVREVRILPENATLDALRARFLEDLGGEAITAAAFLRLHDAVLGARPATSPGVEALLWRPDDDTGIVLTFEVLALEDGAEASADGWERRIDLRVGRATKIQEWSSASAGVEVLTATVGGGAMLEAALDKALSRPLDLAVRAIVRMNRPMR